jgi:Mce-associated membrane protein
MQKHRAAPLFGLVTVVALGAVLGWLWFRLDESRRDQQHHAVLVEAARQGALNLTTIDYANVDADVQRILDSATGEFRQDFDQRSQPFIDVVRQAKSKTEGTVTAAGLESIDGDHARVLVAVSVKTIGDEAEPEPRRWRLRLDVQLDGEQVKVSNVQFVP